MVPKPMPTNRAMVQNMRLRAPGKCWLIGRHAASPK